MSDDEDEMSDSEEELPMKVLPKRVTRGVRVSELHNEGDDDFYSQEFWQEAQVDSDFSEDGSAEDIVDSDFDDTEDESDDEEVVVAKEKGKRKSVYVDKATQNKKQKTAGGKSKVTTAKGRGKAAEVLSPAKKRSLRASTQDKTAKQKEKIKKRVVKKRSEKEMKEWTQEELLAEAKQTEIINKQSLEDLLRIEEFNKKVNLPVKRRLVGPGMLVHSRGGRQSLVFTRQTELPTDVFTFSPAPPYPPKQLKCKITGLPAKYKDPVTNEPYATLAAFKQLRAFQQQQQALQHQPPPQPQAA